MGEQVELIYGKTIKPLYLKNSDILCKNNGRVTDFDLMESVTKVIGIIFIAYNRTEISNVSI